MDKSQYKNVYVFVEQRDGVVQNVALELLGKARELADALHEQVVALLLGKGVKDKADELIAAGADVVLSIEADELAQYTTEPYAQAITQVIHERKPSILLIGATSIGRDLGPRLSARIGTGLTADCTGLDISEDGDLLMTRPRLRRQPDGNDHLQGTSSPDVHGTPRCDACQSGRSDPQRKKSRR